MQVKHIDHLNLTVEDLPTTLAWYRRVFGFVPQEGGVPWAILRSGEALLCLYQHAGRSGPGGTANQGAAIHGLSHFGLRITDREAWEATVEREELDVRYGGAFDWPHSTAWYILDPTGYEIEVALWRDDHVQ